MYREPVKINTVDSVMPKDVKPNFMLMDVQMLEVEALEGMKETIARATDLIIICEWSGFSIHMGQAEYVPRLKKLLTWFEELNFKFYQIEFKNGRSSMTKGTCEK